MAQRRVVSGSDDKQNYTLEEHDPFSPLPDGYNRSMSITDLAVVDGNWLLVMSQDDLLNRNDIGQQVKYGKEWREITKLIREMRSNDYYVTEWGYHDGTYVIVFSNDVGFLDQKYDWKSSFDKFIDMLEAEIRNGWAVTEAFHDGLDWIAVLSRGPGAPSEYQSIHEIYTCEDLSSYSDPIQLIAQGEGRTLAVFAGGSDWQYVYESQVIGWFEDLNDLGQFITDQKSTGRLITALTRVNGQWCAAASRGPESNSGDMR